MKVDSIAYQCCSLAHGTEFPSLSLPFDGRFFSLVPSILLFTPVPTLLYITELANMYDDQSFPGPPAGSSVFGRRMTTTVDRGTLGSGHLYRVTAAEVDGVSTLDGFSL